ncbi:hypothetical protein MRF4_20540 [Methylobacterium radiotolerans]|uniref:hypothetical protein n=1 Tax=Methylobacterium TaxID=407 RepID=UPI002F34E72C
MGTVLPFPQHRARQGASGVRVALVAGRWCIERLEAGDIIARIHMPTQADAQRIAARISRRDKARLLATCLPRPPRRAGTHPAPDDAA